MNPMQEKKPIRLVVLDFDGTLGDTQQLILSTMQKTIATLHLPSRTNEQCKKMIGLPLKQTFTGMIDMSDEMGDKCADVYRRIFEEDNGPGAVPVFPHVLETIKTLKQEGLTLTIASSRASLSLMQFIHDMHLDDDISLVLSCDDITHPKPHPEAVDKTLQLTGFTPEETIVVGDAPYDILMGRNAGCRTVAVSYGNGSVDELKAAEADFIIDDFADLLRIVLGEKPERQE